MSSSSGTDPSRILDFDGFPGRWEILENADETNGERFKTRMELTDSSELPPHVHLKATETYEVESGELEVMVDGNWSTLSAGEKATIPPGTVHAFRNPGPAEVINVHSPAGRYEEYFRQFHALKAERGVHMPPEGIREWILLAMWLARYKDEERAGSRSVQWMITLLAGVGRLLGYRLPDPT